jgi:hypothetical protein
MFSDGYSTQNEHVIVAGCALAESMLTSGFPPICQQITCRNMAMMNFSHLTAQLGNHRPKLCQ